MRRSYQQHWRAEIAALRQELAGCAMTEERKWGKPTFTVDGRNIVIIQDFKTWIGLAFFQGALLQDPQRLLEQLGQVQAMRVMRFTSCDEIRSQRTAIRTLVRAAIAVEKAGLRVRKRTTAQYPVPQELSDRFRRDPEFERAFAALTPGRQRGYLFHFAAAKQSSTRSARIEKAMPAIRAGRGLLERSSRRG